MSSTHGASSGALSDPGNVAAIRDLAVRVGVDMNESGDAMGDITKVMGSIFRVQGVQGAEVIAFPTAVMAKTGAGTDTGVQFASSQVGTFRLDQISSLYRLIKELTRERVDPVAANRELDVIETQRPPFPWPLRVLGHGILTLGFAIMLQPTTQTLIFAFVVGLLIGALKLVHLPTIQIVFPIAVSFLVTVLALLAHQHFDVQDPIRILVPPLITFLPGGALTIGVFELTTNQMMSGASRLVSAFVQLLLLAFGILAATELMRVPLDVLQDDPVASVGPVIMSIGIPIYALGLMLQYCAPPGKMPWIFVVLVVAYLGQLIGSTFFSPQLSGFFGALAMTPLVMFFDSLPKGPTKLITFLPGFWMLVPGAAGLIAVVGIDAQSAPGALNSVFITIIAIALGVLIGSALYNAISSSTRRISRVVTPR